MFWLLLLFGFFLFTTTFIPNKLRKKPAKFIDRIKVFGTSLLLMLIGLAGVGPLDQKESASTQPSKPSPAQPLQTAVVNTKPAPKKEAPWVSTLVTLVKNPKSQKFEHFYPNFDKGIAAYDYTLKLAGKNYITFLALSKSKAWKLTLDGSSYPPAESFAPEEGLREIPELGTVAFDVYEIKSGPLAKTFLKYPIPGKSNLQLVSFSYALEQDDRLGGWLVEQGRVAGIKTIDSGSFVTACQNLIKSNLISPATARFPSIWETVDQVNTDRYGRKTWRSYVDSQNGFGALVRTGFKCTHNPQTDMVQIQLD